MTSPVTRSFSDWTQSRRNRLFQKLELTVSNTPSRRETGRIDSCTSKIVNFRWKFLTQYCTYDVLFPARLYLDRCLVLLLIRAQKPCIWQNLEFSAPTGFQRTFDGRYSEPRALLRAKIRICRRILLPLLGRKQHIVPNVECMGLPCLRPFTSRWEICRDRVNVVRSSRPYFTQIVASSKSTSQ